MLKVLSYILQKSDANEDDYAVAISIALREGENVRAYLWSDTGVKKYPGSPTLIPLYLSSLRLNGRSFEIPHYFRTLADDLRDNPLIQLEYAISMVDIGQLDQALALFTSVRDQDP